MVKRYAVAWGYVEEMTNHSINIVSASTELEVEVWLCETLGFDCVEDLRENEYLAYNMVAIPD